MLKTKNDIVDYSFVPRNAETVNLIVKECEQSQAWQTKEEKGCVFAAIKEGEAKEHLKIYRDSTKNGKLERGAVHFRGTQNSGAHYRTWDLKNDSEHIVSEDIASPTCSSLNFEHSVAGSDEVGTGERFKQIIVTAAYVEPEQMQNLIDLNVRDSKKIKSEHALKVIGEALSGITEAQAREFFDRGEEKITSSDGYVQFQTRILSNQEYDAFVLREKHEGEDKNDLLCKIHAEVLNPLIQEFTPDYVVVDDFMENDPTAKTRFRNTLELDESKLFLRTKADAVNMAVSCASVICSYLSQIYMEWLNETVQKEYGLAADFTMPAGNVELDKVKEMLREAGADAEAVIDKYAKKTFKSKK